MKGNHLYRQQVMAGLVLTGLFLAGAGCATLAGSWDYGLPKEPASTEDRLWYVLFPLSVAAAEQCMFKREETYGFFLAEPAAASAEGLDAVHTEPVLVRFVHPRLPAGKAGMQIGDAIVAINGDPVMAQPAGQVAGTIQRLTRAKIQPLILRLRRADTERDVHLQAIPACRMTVKVVNSPVVNALSDGSSIVVTTGLLGFVRSPDQLAWALAHELGHHALEHTEQAKLQALLSRLLIATSGGAPDPLKRIDLERQADIFAADLMIRAGFDLREARTVLRWIEVLQGPEGDVARSHPANQERIDALDRMIEESEKKRKTGGAVNEGM